MASLTTPSVEVAAQVVSSAGAPSEVRPSAPSLRRNFIVTLGGNIVYAGCQWGVLVALAKLLEPESVGQFILGLTVAAPVFLFANLQLGNIVATDATRQTSFEEYLRLRLLTTLAAAAVVLGLVVASGYPLRTAVVVLAIGVAKTFDAISDIFHGLYQQQERMHHVSASLVCNGIVSLAATALMLWWTRDVLWGAAGFAFGSAVSLVIYNFPTGSAVWRCAGHPQISPETSLWRSVLTRDWHPRVLARLAWLAAPLGVVAGLVTLNANLPRYFIHMDLGDRQLGVFAALAYVMTAGVTFVGALCNSAVPRLARHFADRNFKGFSRLLAKILAVAMAVGLAGITVALVAGRQVLTLLYRPEYAEQSTVFVWLMVAAAISYASSGLGFAVTATRHFSMLLLPYCSVTLTTLAACVILIPRYHLAGAAWAVAASAVAGCVAAAFILVRLWLRFSRPEG